MIPIYLCDDNTEQLLFYKKVIENFIFIENYDMTVKGAFTKPSFLLDEIRKDTPINGIYFLDVDLKAEKDGIELAADIRLLDSRCFIIFITTHEEMAFKTFQYQVEAFDYIIKESTSLLEQIHRCIENIWKRYMQRTGNKALCKQLKINASGTIRLLSPNNITFIESTSASHKIRIHTLNENIELYGSLKEMKKQIDELFINSPFVYSHKACLVNLNRVVLLDKMNKVIVFDDDAKCPYSSRQFSTLSKLLQDNTNN